MKFVLLALFVVSSSAFATPEVKKKVTTEKTETKPEPTVDTKTSTVSEKKEKCEVVDGKEECKEVHSKNSKSTDSKKSY